LIGSLLLALAFLAGCGDGVSSEEDAKKAYMSLDKSVDKAMQLGFQAYNLASSANVDPQTGKGDKTGTLTISGKVDKGASTNKTMTLNEEMKDYSDDGLVTYNTEATALPVIDLKLSKVPDGTIAGTLTGAFTMKGDLEGKVTLNLTIAGDLQPVAGDMTKIERKPGTTHITGTAESDYGKYTVDITR
jgi:hypothetical protein